jgi:ABC-2 type transport system permease protein
MQRKPLNWNLIKYELRNILGNIYVIIFGVFFPIMMSALFSFIFKDEFPEEMYAKVITSTFITMSMIVPMAVLLIGYAANYSEELEKEIPLRMNLFGYRERTMLLAKMIAYLIFMTAALSLYIIADLFILELLVPKLSSALCFIAALYAISVILFVLAHALATFFRRFGPTFAVSMLLYFGIMILCGMMGITVDQLPGVLRAIARLLPMSYIGSDFIEFWQGGSYNFAPLLQSFLFFGAASVILLILSIRKNQRVIK